MKRILIFLLMMIPLLLSAQESGDDVSQGTEFQMGGSVGATTINGETYTRIRLNPELSFWKFGVGLDIDLLITGDGDVRKEDWDEWEDYLNKILYLRYAQREDPLYGLVGSFPSYTLANGLIINGYTNMLNYPDKKKIGGYVGFNTDFSGFGMEMFAADFRQFDIFATRAQVKPLELSSIPLLQNLVVGASFAHDKDQYLRFDDSDGDKVPDIFDDFPNDSNYAVDTDGDGFPDDLDIDADGDNLVDFVDAEWYYNLPPSLQGGVPELNKRREFDSQEKVTIIGTDYLLPIIDSDYFSFYHYAEVAKIIDYGHGFIFPGFGARVAIFDLKLEGRRFEDEFLPGFFDYSYDDQRAFVSGDEIVTKTSTLKNINASTGWYGSATTNIANIVYLDIAYQDMYGKNVTTGKSLWAGLRADTNMIPKIREAAIMYSQTNINYINFSNFRNENATVIGKISYELAVNSFLVGKYQERYTDINNDGKIKGKDETAKTFCFAVEFVF